MAFTPSEKQSLVEKCQKKDSKAWHKFINLYASLIYKKIHKTLITYNLHNSLKQEIDDIFQEVFIKIFHSLENLKNPESLEKWIIQVSFSVTIDYIRTFLRHTKEIPLEPDQEFVDEKTKIVQEIEKHEILEKIERCVQKLPPKEQLVIRLFYEQGLKYREISNLLGLTIGGVGSLKTHAEKKIKKMLMGGQNE